MKFDIGAMVWVDFPFEDDPSKSKIRLGVIIATTRNKFRVLFITSQSKYQGLPGFVEVLPPNAKVPSYIDVNRFYDFDEQAIIADHRLKPLEGLKLELVLQLYKKRNK